MKTVKATPALMITGPTVEGSNNDIMSPEKQMDNNFQLMNNQQGSSTER